MRQIMLVFIYVGILTNDLCVFCVSVTYTVCKNIVLIYWQYTIIMIFALQIIYITNIITVYSILFLFHWEKDNLAKMQHFSLTRENYKMEYTDTVQYSLHICQ